MKVHRDCYAVESLGPFEASEITLGDELGFIFETELCLPLLGPLLRAQESHGELRDKVRVLDGEDLGVSIVVFERQVQRSLGEYLDSPRYTFQIHSLHRF